MYHFIVNPNARSGLGSSVWKQIEIQLRQKDIPYTVFFTQYQHHATTYVKSLTSDGKEHILIALGGDGTVNEIVNGIADFDKVTFGYIPIGSSNDFARGMRLPQDPVKALNIILNSSRIKAIDIGILTCISGDGREKERRFAVSTGIGFDAAVCHQAVVSRLKVILNKLHLGKLTYAGIALNRLLYDTPQRIAVTLADGTHQIFDKAYFAVAMNTPYEGGGFLFCPKALPYDRELDILIVSGLPRLQVLLLLPTAFKGWHVFSRHAHLYRSKEILIETEKALPVHTDGEPIFLQRKIKAACADVQLKMFLPG